MVYSAEIELQELQAPEQFEQPQPQEDFPALLSRTSFLITNATARVRTAMITMFAAF